MMIKSVVVKPRTGSALSEALRAYRYLDQQSNGGRRLPVQLNT